MNKLYTAVGLMSGTSGDGIDASIIQSDGEKRINIVSNHYCEYEDEIKNEIIALKRKINNPKDLKTWSNEIDFLEKKITVLHINFVLKILKETKNLEAYNGVDVLGFHGQTIYHNANEKISKQMGDGLLLSKSTRLNTVFNFRRKDLLNGGQGAPLTPIYHKLIYENLNLSYPVAFVNIGGISNITFISKENKIISFDSGPGNILIDRFIQNKSNDKIKYDKDGEIALKGNYNEILLENYLNNPFFEIEPPKTLDTNDFSLSIIRGLTFENSVTTLSELTARTIVDSLNFLKQKPKKIILCGGGRKNKFLFNRIKNLSKIETISIDEERIDGDFVESQAFAYLAVRTLTEKPISFPETTGVKFPCVCGELIKFK